MGRGIDGEKVKGRRAPGNSGAVPWGGEGPEIIRELREVKDLREERNPLLSLNVRLQNGGKELNKHASAHCILKTGGKGLKGSFQA